MQDILGIRREIVRGASARLQMDIGNHNLPLSTWNDMGRNAEDFFGRTTPKVRQVNRLYLPYASADQTIRLIAAGRSLASADCAEVEAAKTAPVRMAQLQVQHIVAAQTPVAPRSAVTPASFVYPSGPPDGGPHYASDSQIASIVLGPAFLFGIIGFIVWIIRQGRVEPVPQDPVDRTTEIRKEQIRKRLMNIPVPTDPRHVTSVEGGNLRRRIDYKEWGTT